MVKRKVILLVFSLLGIITLTAVLSLARIASAQTAPHTVQDTPEPVLEFNQDIGEWRLAAGFIYLIKTCHEVLPPDTAFIWRRVVNGTSRILLESANSRPACRTFRHAAADESGIYYYNRQLGRLEAIYSDTPSAPPTPLATIGDQNPIGSGDGISTLRLDNNYVYWIELVGHGEFLPADVAIKRVSKNGGAPATLFSYTSLAARLVSYEGLGVTGTHIWWTDANGLNRINSCTVQICPPGTVSKTTQFPLLAGNGYIQVNASAVYWWSGDENPEKIRRTRCSIVGNNCTTNTVLGLDEDIDIIGLATNDQTLFWTEWVPQIGRRLRRAALSGGTKETMLENLYEGYAVPYVDVDGVYFQLNKRTIARLPLDATALVREISVAGWEVTQGIQRPLNDVPLVAGKTTFVRLYPSLDDGNDAGSAAAVLYGSRDGEPLPGSPLYPISPTIRISPTLTLANREQIDSGWLFMLPEDWTRTGAGLIPQEDTTITLRGVIDPNGVYADSDNPVNNEIAGDFLFSAKAPTCMIMRSIIAEAPYQSVRDIVVGQVVEFSESVLPTPRLIIIPNDNPLRETEWCWDFPYGYGPYCSGPFEMDDDENAVLGLLGWSDYWADFPEVCTANDARTLYAGILHRQVKWSRAGLAEIGLDQFITTVPGYGTKPLDRLRRGAYTMVHEMSHNYGRRHVNCGSPKKPDLNYPYPTNMIDFNLPLGSPNLHFGFDPLLFTPMAPNTTVDYMSYCGPKWYSDYTWKGIFNNTAGTLQAAVNAKSSLNGDLVRIAGMIDGKNNWGTLDYAWSIPSSLAGVDIVQRWADDLTANWRADSVRETYHVQLLGTNDQILADRVVELTEVEDGDAAEPTPFNVSLAAPPEMVTSLQLLAGDTILATLYPGTAKPVISIDQPEGGANIGTAVTVGWTAADPDGDKLLYTILYSANNGESWVPLLVNYAGTSTPEESITLDLSSEAGSFGSSALIRVLASDGYNTALATSAPFNVAQRAPFVTITSPGDNQFFAAGQTILLNGLANDPEDGLIAEDQFAWSTGQSGSVASLNGLAPGAYDLQLTAVDSDGHSGSASLEFNVAPLAVPQTTAALTLDGRCDDAGYNFATQLPLSPYADGSRAGAFIVHSPSKMWLCLTGLKGIEGYAGLLLDADNSSEKTVQSGDFGTFVQADGTRIVSEGNGSTWEQVSAGDLSARVFDNGVVWSTELRIDDSVFGGWRKRVGLAVGHFGQDGNSYSIWPHSAATANPQSWGETNLGLAATITNVIPDSALFDGEDIALTVKGAGFDTDNMVLWNGTTVAASLVNASTLQAQIPAASIPSAGVYNVSIGTEGSTGLTTAGYPFTVINPQPAITGLSPETAEIGHGPLTLTIQGAGFVNGAAVVWNGETRPAAYVSPTKLRINLAAEDLAFAYKIPVVVINPEPSQNPSNSVMFVISPGRSQLFIPLIHR